MSSEPSEKLFENFPKSLKATRAIDEGIAPGYYV
jgi:hypothetical protein